jgi:nitroreductase
MDSMDSTDGVTVDGGRPSVALSLQALGAPRVEPARDGSPPDHADLARILHVATTVPDHGGLRPWRFVVITGAGRDRFGRALVDGLVGLKGEGVPEGAVTKMRGKAFAAPCAVMVVSSPRRESNVPEWEQVVSASCTGYAIVLGATALGLGAVWKSAAVLDTEPVRVLFGAEEHERLLGWVNLGSPGQPSRKKGVYASGGAPDTPVTVVGD